MSEEIPDRQRQQQMQWFRTEGKVAIERIKTGIGTLVSESVTIADIPAENLARVYIENTEDLPPSLQQKMEMERTECRKKSLQEIEGNLRNLFLPSPEDLPRYRGLALAYLDTLEGEA